MLKNLLVLLLAQFGSKMLLTCLIQILREQLGNDAPLVGHISRAIRAQKHIRRDVIL